MSSKMFWIVVLICLAITTAHAQIWGLTGSLAYARDQHTATLLPNGNVLIAGGYNNGPGAVLNSAELYNAPAGLWTVTDSLSYGRTQHTATLLLNGNVLVAGGDTNGGNTAELYNATTGVWTLTGSLTYARQWYGATLLQNGDVLVAGGQGNSYDPYLKSAELYNATTGVWTVTGSLTYAHFAHTVTLLANGNVLVAGGGGSTYPLPSYNSVELYNAITGVWNVTGSLSYGRYSHTATLLLNGNVLVAGGEDNSGGNTAELYNATTGVWTVTGNLTYGRADHTATLLPDGNVLVAGGLDVYNNVLDSAEVYNATTGEWTVTGSLTYAHFDHTATVLPNGNVLVAGGGPSGNLNRVEIYITTEPTFLLDCCFVSQGIYSDTTISSNLQVDCVNCSTLTSFGNFSFDFYNTPFFSIILTCTNCPALTEFGVFPSQALIPAITLICNMCTALVEFGTFSLVTGTSLPVNLSCTYCSSLTSLGSFPLLTIDAPISLACINCPAITSTTFSSLPLNQQAASIELVCNNCPSSSFFLDAPIVFAFSGSMPSAFSSVASASSLSISNSVLSNSFQLSGLLRIHALSFINVVGVSNLDYLAGLARVDDSITIQQTSITNIDGITANLALVESVTITDNPVLCNIDNNKLQSVSSSPSIISNNGFNTTCTLPAPLTPSQPSLVLRGTSFIQLTWSLPAQPSVLTTYSLLVNSVTFVTFTSWNPVGLPFTLNSLSPGSTYSFVLSAVLNGIIATSSSLTVITDSGVTSNCLPGYYKPNNTCLPCGAAQFPSDDFSTCVSCPSGTYANASALASSASCQLCPSGTYSSGQATQCSSCPSHYCPFGAAAALSSSIYASPANASIASSSTSNTLSLGYIYLIVFFVLTFVSGLVVAIFRKRMRSIVLKFAVLIRTPRFLFRVNLKDGSVSEMPSIIRGLIGFWVLLGLILVTAFQINNFIINQFGSTSTIQPGTTFSSGLSTLSATTIMNVTVVLFASPITCDPSLFSTSSTINGAVSCTSNATTTTFTLTTTLSSLPSTATNLQLAMTATNGNLAYSPALQYSFTSLRYNNLNYSVAETIVGGSNTVVTGTTTINIAAVATESLDVNGATLNTGYDFSYISTNIGTSSTPSSSLVLSFQLSVPQYFLQVRQVVAITPLVFLSGLLAIGGGVISAGTLIAFAISYFSHTWLRKGLSAAEESSIDMADTK